MTRWLVLPIGFVLVAAAGYALLSAAPPPKRSLPVATSAPVGDPHGEIDEASRAKLRALLREADREENAGGGSSARGGVESARRTSQGAAQ